MVDTGIGVVIEAMRLLSPRGRYDLNRIGLRLLFAHYCFYIIINN